MRKTIVSMAAAVILAAGAARAQDAGCSPCKGCGQETYGTSVVWEGTPAEAATKAQAEGKLVFVLHVSGLFEDPAFT